MTLKKKHRQDDIGEGLRGLSSETQKKKEKEGKAVILYMDESYVHQQQCGMEFYI